MPRRCLDKKCRSCYGSASLGPRLQLRKLGPESARGDVAFCVVSQVRKKPEGVGSHPTEDTNTASGLHPTSRTASFDASPFSEARTKPKAGDVPLGGEAEGRLTKETGKDLEFGQRKHDHTCVGTGSIHKQEPKSTVLISMCYMGKQNKQSG